MPPQRLETLQALDDLCKKYKNIFPLDQENIGHTKLLIMNNWIQKIILLLYKNLIPYP